MGQIAFLTLFLGLVHGLQPVELTVTGPVSAVELRLDGVSAGRLAGPPWKGQIDFGQGLMPRELVAQALDGQGNEIGRARQWINLPRPPAEAEILLEHGPSGLPPVARLTWQSLTGEKPSAIEVTFDNQRLAVEPDGRIRLPAWDPDTTHVLSAELHFSDGLTARRDVAFSGPWGEEVSTELTAVPVRLRKGKKLPSPGQMQGWFRAAGRPVAVAAVEEGPAELLAVCDPKAQKLLQELLAGRSQARPNPGVRGAADEEDYAGRRYSMTLGKKDSIRIVVPAVRTVEGSTLPADLFGQSGQLNARDGGLLWFLALFSPPIGTRFRNPRLTDAVAVAGLQALHGNRRRAVLLVLSEQPEDASQADPATVRRYLEAIRVPLFVWTLGDPAAPAAAAWGRAEKVVAFRKLKEAFNRLKDDLAAQRIVLVDGRHLPQTIELSPAAAEAFELVR